MPSTTVYVINYGSDETRSAGDQSYLSLVEAYSAFAVGRREHPNAVMTLASVDILTGATRELLIYDGEQVIEATI